MAGEANVAKLHGCMCSKKAEAWSFCIAILAIKPPKEYLAIAHKYGYSKRPKHVPQDTEFLGSQAGPRHILDIFGNFSHNSISAYINTIISEGLSVVA